MNPVHQYEQEGKYDVTLTVVDSAGCRNIFTKSNYVEVNRFVNVIVPNAFSPNGDGKNDRIFIKGFGIAKINWRIFSRWGELVFFSNNPLLGWDGALKGKLLPQDVYHYILDVEFSDGKKTIKKGDITLLR